MGSTSRNYELPGWPSFKSPPRQAPLPQRKSSLTASSWFERRSLRGRSIHSSGRFPHAMHPPHVPPVPPLPPPGVLRIREEKAKNQGKEQEHRSLSPSRPLGSSPPLCSDRCDSSPPDRPASSPPSRPARPAPALQSLPDPHPPVHSSSFRLGKPGSFSIKGRHAHSRNTASPPSSSLPSPSPHKSSLSSDASPLQQTMTISSPKPVKPIPHSAAYSMENYSFSPGISSRSAGTKASPMVLATASAFHPRYGHTSLEEDRGRVGKRRGGNQSPSYVQPTIMGKGSPALRKLKDLTPPEMNYVISALDAILARNSDDVEHTECPIYDRRESQDQEGFDVPPAPTPADKDLDDIIMSYEWSGEGDEEIEAGAERLTKSINLQEARKRLRAAGSFSRILS
ncbi:hypothetical protein BJ684DRAFT_19354, partial [Piptocephalis cylindrospora]